MAEFISIHAVDAVSRAAEAIKAGELIILPTDTVYGIAASTWNPEAVEALYRAKGRMPDKAIPVLLADLSDLPKVAETIPATVKKLAARFWPGPLTMTVPKAEGLPEIVSQYPTVGVRIPDHIATRTTLRVCGGTLAVTSANLSDEPAAHSIEELPSALLAHVVLVLDGGTTPGAKPSTVIGFEDDEVKLIREGPISLTTLLDAL